MSRSAQDRQGPVLTHGSNVTRFLGFLTICDESLVTTAAMHPSAGPTLGTGLRRCCCGGEMAAAGRREVGKRGACGAPASHGHPWRASASGLGERSSAHPTKADLCPVMLTDIWAQEEPRGGQASLGSCSPAGSTGGGHPCRLQEPGREER